MKDMLILLCWLPLWGAAAPRIYYTDIVQGPSVPANGGKGAFVTIYGAHFGDSASGTSVTIGGAEPEEYISWSDSKIVVRLGRRNAPGKDLPLTVTRGGMVSNRNVTFTIENRHKIYYFDPKLRGSEGSCRKGTEASPWKYAREDNSPADLSFYWNHCLSSGDILYVRAGTIDTSDAYRYQSVFTIGQNASASYLSAVAYPGEVVTLDAQTAAQRGKVNFVIRDKGYGGTHVTIAGFDLIGSGISGAGLVSDYGRLVGNTITGPNLCVYDAVTVGAIDRITSGQEILGNEITNVSTACNGGTGAQKLMHSIYAKCSNCEVAWNYIHGNRTYNGIQFHNDALVHKGGYYNILIHDNWIQDQYGNGINLSTIDFPSGGAKYIKVYNNVLYNEGFVALTNNESGGGQIKGCIALKDGGNPAAAGTVQVYNNTMAACLGIYDPDYGAQSGIYGVTVGIFNDERWGNDEAAGALFKGGGQPQVLVQMTNNIVYAPAYYWTDAARGSRRRNPYIASTTVRCCMTQITGTHNLWFGQDRSFVPAAERGTVADPQFTAYGCDFDPLPGSPALGHGGAVEGANAEVEGLPRRAGRALDIGAPSFPRRGCRGADRK